jgi:hypothetical protein
MMIALLHFLGSVRRSHLCMGAVVLADLLSCEYEIGCDLGVKCVVLALAPP